MTKEIQLTQGYVALVDDDMYPFLSRWNWHYGPGEYAVRGSRITGKYQNIFLHRIVAHLMFGEIAQDYEVDHRDGNRLNCTTANIRLASQRENAENRSKGIGFTSTYKGVYWKKSLGKWGSKIAINGKSKHLGYFHDESEAGRIYDAAARQYHGEFARLNFPNEV